jgi:hypothetical protein
VGRGSKPCYAAARAVGRIESFQFLRARQPHVGEPKEASLDTLVLGNSLPQTSHSVDFRQWAYIQTEHIVLC